MNFKNTTKKLGLVAGILGVCGIGFLAPEASAKPKPKVRSTTTTRTTTIIRNRPVTRTTTVVRTTPVVRNRTIVTNRPVVVRPRTTTVRRTVTRNRYVPQPGTYNGRVSYVSGGRFGITVGGRPFNVFPSSGVPRNLNRGDWVRVIGTRSNTTIRASRVYITRNL